MILAFFKKNQYLIKKIKLWHFLEIVLRKKKKKVILAMK